MWKYRSLCGYTVLFSLGQECMFSILRNNPFSKFKFIPAAYETSNSSTSMPGIGMYSQTLILALLMDIEWLLIDFS